MKEEWGMVETGRVSQLERENLELKKEVETLFQTVVQLKDSLNLLLDCYVINGKDTEGNIK